MCKVRFEKRGFLYVEVEDIDSEVQVIKIKNPLEDIPRKVDVVKIRGEYYIRGYEPKTNYNRRKSIIE